MRSVLKGLGLTIWGLIAFGLLAIFIFVGYQAALRHRAPGELPVDDNGTNHQSSTVQTGSTGDVATQSPAHGAPTIPIAPEPLRAPDAARSSVLNTAQDHRHDSAIEPGSQPSVTVARIPACKDSGRDKPRVILDSAQRARIDRLLNRTEAARAESGDPFVKLGERYYGIGEYEIAIASLQRGLNKGQVKHLDEAYVYLGLSEQAVGDLEAARDAFSKLQSVPGISPRVLRLWTLYAQTHLEPSRFRSKTDDVACP